MWRSDLVPGVVRFFRGLDHQLPLQGWQRVKWGQSYDDVKRYFPQARASGDYELVLEPAQGTVDRPYQITLAFDLNHQLESVTLSFAGSRETADFAELSQRLNYWLGAPVSSTDTSTTWQRDTSQAELSMAPGGGVVLSQRA